MLNISFIFPGQGAQVVGMGKEFYDASAKSKEIFDKADRLIPSLKDVTFNGPQEKLTSTAFCQPAIFTYSMAALEAFKAHPKYKLIQPVFACGLSLGELSAVCASGALTFDEALKIVERRSAFMDEACRLRKGAMAAVIGMDKDKIIELCLQCQAEVANFNSPDQTVITGTAQSVDDAARLIKEQGAKRVIALDVAGAFHSSLMKPAVPKFQEELKKAYFKIPAFPVVSNVDAVSENNPDYIRRNLSLQITSSVQWVNTVNFIAAQGVSHFIEIGPGTVLKGLIRKINPELKVFNIQTPQDIESLVF